MVGRWSMPPSHCGPSANGRVASKFRSRRLWSHTVCGVRLSGQWISRVVTVVALAVTVAGCTGSSPSSVKASVQANPAAATTPSISVSLGMGSPASNGVEIWCRTDGDLADRVEVSVGPHKYRVRFRLSAPPSSMSSRRLALAANLLFGPNPGDVVRIRTQVVGGRPLPARAFLHGSPLDRSIRVGAKGATVTLEFGSASLRVLRNGQGLVLSGGVLAGSDRSTCAKPQLYPV